MALPNSAGPMSALGHHSPELAAATHRFVSAVPPIATDSVPRNERTQRAKNGPSAGELIVVTGFASDAHGEPRTIERVGSRPAVQSATRAGPLSRA
jgi:hypothetical protein